MTNRQVKQAFMKHKAGNAENLISTGIALLSYGWWEVAKWVDSEIVVRNERSYSRTTASKHRSGVYGRKASRETPVTQGEMKL